MSLIAFKVPLNYCVGFHSVNAISDFNLSLFSAVTFSDSMVRPTTEPALFINILIQFLSLTDKLSPAAKHRMKNKTSRDVLIKNSSCQMSWISKKEESWQNFFLFFKTSAFILIPVSSKVHPDSCVAQQFHHVLHGWMAIRMSFFFFGLSKMYPFCQHSL